MSLRGWSRWLFLLVGKQPKDSVGSPEARLGVFLSSLLSAARVGGEWPEDGGGDGVLLCQLKESFGVGFSISLGDAPSCPITELVSPGRALRTRLQPQGHSQESQHLRIHVSVPALTRWPLVNLLAFVGSRFLLLWSCCEDAKTLLI